MYTVPEGDRLVHNGNSFSQSFVEGLSLESMSEENYRIYDSAKTFVGIFRKKGNMFLPVKMFYTQEIKGF